MSKEIAQTVGGKRIAWLIAIVAAFAVIANFSGVLDKVEAAEMPQATLNSLEAADTAVINTFDSELSGNESAISVSEPAGTKAIDLQLGGTASFAHLVGDSRFVQSGSSDGKVNAAVSTIAEQGTHPGNPWTAKNIGDSDNFKSNPLDERLNSFRGEPGITCRVSCGVHLTETKTNTVDVPNAASFGSIDLSGVTWARGGEVTDRYVALVEGFNGETAEFIDSGTNIVFGSTIGRYGSGEVIASSASASGFDGYSSGILPNTNLDGTGPSDQRPEASSQEGLKASEGDATTMWLYILLGLGALAFGIAGSVVARRSR